MSRFFTVDERNKNFYQYLLIALIALFYLLNLKDGQNWGGDFSMYIMNAKNIVNGAPYSQTNYVYNVDAAYYGPKAYPPVFPLMLAPVIAIWGVNFIALKCVGIISLIGLLVYFKKFILPQDMQFIVQILFIITIGFYPQFFNQVDNVLSDIPFLLFCAIALNRINNQVCSKDQKENPWINPILTGIIIYLAYGTRSIGLCLVPVIFSLDLLRNRRISLSTIITVSMAFLLIVLQTILIPDTGSYIDQLPRNLHKAISLILGSRKYFFLSFSSIFYFKNIDLKNTVFMVSLVFVLIGLFKRVKNGPSSFELFCLFYLTVLTLWSSRDTRLFYPIIPFYILYLLEGFQHFINYVKPVNWLAKALPVLLLFALLVYYINFYTMLIPRPAESSNKKETQELFHFVQTQTNSSDVISFFKPRVLALFTDRKSVAIAFPAPNGINPLERMKQLGVTYTIIRLNYGVEFQAETSNLVQQNPDYFHLIYENPDFQVYRFTYDVNEASAIDRLP